MLVWEQSKSYFLYCKYCSTDDNVDAEAEAEAEAAGAEADGNGDGTELARSDLGKACRQPHLQQLSGGTGKRPQ